MGANDNLSINGDPGGPVDLASDPARIIEIAKADAAQLPRMRDQRDGWDELDKLAAHVTGFLEGRMEERLSGNASKALSVVAKHAARTRKNVELFREAAEFNGRTYDHVIPEVERLNERVETLSGEISDIDKEIDKMPPELAETDRKSITDVKGGLQTELRRELEKSSGQYQTVHRIAYSPPDYQGAPEWTGPEPRVYPGGTREAGIVNNGGTAGKGPGGLATADDRPIGAANDAPGGRPDGGSSIPDDSPQLQTPSGPAPTPTPGTTPPVTGTAPPMGGGGGLPVVPPGGPVPNMPGGKPVVPPATGRPGPAGPIARPTPSMAGKPISGPGGMPNSGRGGGGSPQGRNAPMGRGVGGGAPARNAPSGSKASRALLPNQRGGTGGSTGTGGAANRGGTGTGGGAPNRGAAGRSGSKTARGGTTPGRPGNGTETFGGPKRATVPPVIGGRGGATPPSTTTPSASMRGAGKVFGERKNKGKPKPSAKQKGGILARNGAAKSKQNRDWSHAPKPRRSGEALQGKVFGKRDAPMDPLEAAAQKAQQRSREAAQAKAVAQWRARRNALPDNELLDGVDSTVVPDVISGSQRRSDQVRRTDVGPVFGAGGWENTTVRKPPGNEK